MSATTVSMRVAVDPLTAFDVFTKEIDAWWRKVPKYQFHPGRWGTMMFEAGVGGRLIMDYGGSPEDIYEIGRVQVWDPGRRLKFDWRLPNFEPGQVTEVDVQFEAADGETRVTLTHGGWECLPEDHPAKHGRPTKVHLILMGNAWRELLYGLRKRVEKRHAGN